MLEFSGTSNDRSVTFILFDKSGKELWRLTKKSEELGVKKKK
jgi:hypothetical protein